MKRLTIGEHVVDWVGKIVRAEFDGARGIGLLRTVQTAVGEQCALCAGVVYEDWNGVNITAHIAAEGRNWATPWFLGVIFDYPFVQLKCNRITVCVGEQNRDSRRFVGHLGFTQEANLQGAHPTGDLIVYRMFRDDCRYLKEPYANLHSRSLRLAA